MSQTSVQPPITPTRVLLVILMLATTALVVEVFINASIWLSSGVKAFPEYFNLHWANSSELSEIYLKFSGFLWGCFSAVYFGYWLLHRSIRKFRRDTWRLENKRDHHKHFLPSHLLLYLQVSTIYLFIIITFFLLQYPLQFIIFSN